MAFSVHEEVFEDKAFETLVIIIEVFFFYKLLPSDFSSSCLSESFNIGCLVGTLRETCTPVQLKASRKWRSVNQRCLCWCCYS